MRATPEIEAIRARREARSKSKINCESWPPFRPGGVIVISAGKAPTKSNQVISERIRKILDEMKIAKLLDKLQN